MSLCGRQLFDGKNLSLENISDMEINFTYGQSIFQEKKLVPHYWSIGRWKPVMSCVCVLHPVSVFCVLRYVMHQC